MAAFSCGSTPSGVKNQCTGKDNYDRLMALYHTGTDVKRHLLQHHLSKKKIDLLGYLYGRYQFLPPDDIKRVLRTKNVQLSDLGIYAIDTLLLDQCFDLFWDSCLDKDDMSLENILNKYKENLYRLYKTSGHDDNKTARNARKRKYLSKKQWEYLYQGPEMEDIKKYNFHLYLTFPNKGLTIQSFDNDMHFILLSNVCPLYKSLQVVTTNQMKLSRIAVEHDINNEVFYEIWEQIATHLKHMSKYCSCETYYDYELDLIKKSTLNRIKTQENRKYILESTFDNKTFSEDAEFMNRVQKELNLIDAEETKDLVSKLCDKEIPVLLVHGKYIAGSYPLAVEKAARQDLESCQSICSRQATNINLVSTSDNIDVLEEQKSIDRHSYLRFVCLIQDVAQKVLVGVLKGRLPGANVGNALNGMKNRLLPFLNSYQKQLLYPDDCSKYTGDLSDLDVSLLYIILRNLGTISPHQNGWGKNPEDHDQSISANIDRIRIAKNLIVSHSSNCSLGYGEFNNRWETIRRCCVELGGEQYEEIIDTLLTSTFNSDLEKRFSEKLEYLKEKDVQTERYCRHLEEILDSAKDILVNLQREQAYRGINTSAKYEEDCTPMTLRFKGTSLPHKNEIKEQIGAYKNNDIRVTSVEDGSILIRLQMFSSAFQSFGYVLTVFDKLLQHTFSTGLPLENNSVVCITIFLEMHHSSEVVDEGNMHDLTLKNAQGKRTTEETIVPGIDKCSIEKSESVLYEGQKEQKAIQKHRSKTVVDEGNMHDLTLKNAEGKRTTEETIVPGIDKCSIEKSESVLYEGQKEQKTIKKHRSKTEKERKLPPDLSDREKISIWFYNVLEAIGINEDHRKTCQQAAIMSEILFSFTGINTYYLTGSSVEGTFAAGEEHDYAVIQCDDFHHVFEKLEESVIIRNSFLIIREGTTPAGYVKLQVLVNGKPLKHLSMLNRTRFSRQRCTVDTCGRIVLHHMIPLPEDEPFLQRKQMKPTIKTENNYGTCVDNYLALRCKQWPTFAQEWISRDRLFGWPTKSMVHKLSSFGFFVVKKGHSLSPENDLEWRISFSLQERKLMFSLTDVQHKCYTVLKMFNREIIRSNCITSYHWKTCLFYVIEQHGEVFWKHNFLVFCIKMCIMNMLKWVLIKFCPNYFIPEQNLFSGTLNNSEKHILVSKLGDLLQDGFDCLLNVKAGKISEYYRTRKTFVHLQQLQLDTNNISKIALYIIRWRRTLDITLDRFNKTILDRYYYHANENVLPFIQNLWSTLHRIIDTNTVTEHTTEETKYALSALLPHIYTCLASNIAAIAIKNTNPRIRDFLLLGSFTLFKKGALSGLLKFISVLYAIERFDDCEYYIDQLNEDYMIHISSVCCCRLIENDIEEEFVSNLTPLNMSTCVSFLTSELPITPDALKYEMFRFFGISVTTEERAHSLFQWNYRAVVDSNVYFFFLKFLIKQKRTRFNQSTYLLDNIKRLLDGHQVKHRDVAFNLIAWVFVSLDFYTPIALECVKLSLDAVNSVNLFHFMIKKEMIWKQYQFNAAKWHFLVALYNTWTAKKPPSVKFCFQCLNRIRADFKICSTCHISTYCSNQCQINNWKIHKAACVIANRCSTKKNTYLRQPKLK